MTGLPSRILQLADESPEGTVLCANALLHLGTRAAVDQALSRLARRSELMRICQGIYVQPVQFRFGLRPPSIGKVLASLSTFWGEPIVPCGALAANAFGLTTQVPMRLVYLTSGPDRKLTFGRLIVEMRHAPPLATGRTPSARGRCGACPVLVGPLRSCGGTAHNSEQVVS